MLCAHTLACLFFFVGRWQILNLNEGAKNEFTGEELTGQGSKGKGRQQKGWERVSEKADSRVRGVQALTQRCGRAGEPWLIGTCLQFADATTQYNVALYWAYATICTVGYGDITPVTNMDRSFAMAVMLSSGTLQVKRWAGWTGEGCTAAFQPHSQPRLRPLTPPLQPSTASQAFILANVAMAISAFGFATARVNERIKLVLQALRFYDVHADMQERVVDAVQYYWAQHKGVDDDEVLPLLPDRCAAAAWRPGAFA